MRCRRHIADLSSTVGVCATCLRERLLSVIAAQSSSSSSSSHHYQNNQHHQHRSRNQVHAQLLAAAASSLDQHRKSDFDRSLQSKSDLQAERIVFPRSVSPYLLRGRKLYEEEEELVLPDRRFYSTPQIGQMINDRERKHAHGHGGRFSFFSGWFRPKSDRSDLDFKLPHETKASTSSSSSSWFSSIRRKHKSKPPETATTSERLPRRVVLMDRGMTPERLSCVDADEFDHKPSSRMEFVSDSCKRTPARGVKPSSNLSGMAFCMSPLVRASPARLWNQRKSVPSDIIGFSGEIRSVGNHPHLSTASSHCANRSRKLVDFGRASHHH